jgi:hypothetical protein
MEETKNVEADEKEPVQLTPEQKKTIWEWVKYLTKELAIAILKRLTG